MDKYYFETRLLLMDEVHPSKVNEQHENWKRNWCSLENLVINIDCYQGLLFCYFIDYKNHVLYKFENVEDAIKEFNPETCVWIDVSCYQCIRVDKPSVSW